MPPASRRQKQSATHHDKRNDAGLAQPWKRIPKQKSNGQLNGNARKDHVATTAAATSSSSSSHDVVTADESRLRKDSDGYAETHRLEQETVVGGPAGVVADEGHTIIHTAPYAEGQAEPDVMHLTANGTLGTPASRAATNSGDRQMTVIGSHLLCDVVAILLLLLQLPPPLLVAVQFVFTLVTIGLSYSGISLASLTQWSHSHGGNPSIVAIALADLCILAGWAIIPWSWLKEIALDLAQVVVAMTLGGGGSSKSGATYGSVCVGVIATSHLLRKKTLRESAINFLTSVLPRVGIGTAPLSSAIPSASISTYSTRGWTRTLLEIHIIAQGIVAVIRRAHSRRAEPPPLLRTGQELASIVVSSATADSEGGRNSSSDGRPPGPSPSAREREKSVSSAKRRRKQATLVRSQQPFWAAIANTKVLFSKKKELEQSLFSRDIFESGSRDVNHLGDAVSSYAGDQVWIAKINDSDIWFSALIGVKRAVENAYALDEDNNSQSFDIALRVNGANWNSLACTEIDRQSDGIGGEIKLLKGKIFGLTPLTSYLIEFVNVDKDQVIFSVNLLTRPVATSEPGVSAAPPPRQSLRPLSPTTTLKQSIAAAENNLTEQRQRLKKIRKDHRNTANAFKKDVDGLESRLSSSGGTDERQRQKKIQYQQAIRQAEDTISAIASQIEDLGEIPASEKQDHDKSKQSWESARQEHAAMKQELEKAKSEYDQRVNAVKAEVAGTRQKRERAEARLARLEQQRETLVSTNEQTRRDKARRESNRASVAASQQAREHALLTSIEGLQGHRQEVEAATATMEQQIHFYESGFQQGAPTHSPESAPMQLNNHSMPPFQPKTTFQFPAGNSGPPRSRQGSMRQKTRGRSSSMLSDISGFTEDEAGTPQNHHYHHVDMGGDAPGHYQPRKKGSGSDSQREQSSPVARLSPIGAEVGRGSPRELKRSL